jgi:hypothetical protein
VGVELRGCNCRADDAPHEQKRRAHPPRCSLPSNRYFEQHPSPCTGKMAGLIIASHAIQYQFRKSLADSPLTYLYDCDLRNQQPRR